MTKELEALEDIILFLNANEPKGLYCKNIEILKAALRDCEMEHTLRIRLENTNYELVREKQDNEKKLKACEMIIKELKLKMSVDEDVGCLYVPITKCLQPLEQNIVVVGFVHGQDKIDLLREVLL